MSNALATTTSTSGWLLAPQSFGELMQFCELISKSDLAPKDYRGKPGNCIVAIQLGAALGLSPMQSLQGIAVIGGKPAAYGDALLAVVQSFDAFEDMQETFDGVMATCVAKRRGRSTVTRTFSIDDAKKAALWGKQGPWTLYPFRMLQMRARAFALRDLFADRLMGLQSAEEMQDIDVGTIPTVVDKVPASAVRVAGPVIHTAASLAAATEQLESKPNPERPRFKWQTNKQWDGKPVNEAPADVIATYVQNLTALLNDASRTRLHKWALEHREAVELVLESKILDERKAESPAGESIADKLQSVIDGRLAEPDNDDPSWVSGEVTT